MHGRGSLLSVTISPSARKALNSAYEANAGQAEPQEMAPACVCWWSHCLFHHVNTHSHSTWKRRELSLLVVTLLGRGDHLPLAQTETQDSADTFTRCL